MRKNVFPAEFLEEIKSRIDIVSLVSRYISLQRKGRYYWACCPFHYEKTPSFVVNQEEHFYHCYGCGENGDVITFLMKYDKITFTEAVKNLAKEAGLQVPDYNDSKEELERLRQKEKALRALNAASDFYKQVLYSKDGIPAQEYVKTRSFNKSVLDDFCIGYSPDWISMPKYLISKGFDLKTLKLAGLIDYNEYNKYYDVFGTRLIFPIRNSFGDTIGFTARTLKTDSKYAKYKNSTQNIVFDKSKTVYNIDAIKNLRKTEKIDCIYVCEGTIDVIAMYRAGIKNCVACMGTAITPFHAQELKRYTDKINLCLDGDSAGQHAMFKAIDVFSSVGLEVRVVKLKENLDPDEYLKKYGKEEIVKAINQTIDAIEYKIMSIKEKYDMNNGFQKGKFVNESLNILRPLSSDSQKEFYLKKLSLLSQVPIDILRRDMYNVADDKKVEEASQLEKELEYRKEGHQKAQQFVLASLVHKKDYSQQALSYNLKFKNGSYQRLFDFVKKCHDEQKTYTISTLYDYFDTDENRDIAEIIGYNFQNIDDPSTYFEQCLGNMLSVDLKIKQEELKKQFNVEKDVNKRKEILAELGRISKELKNG